MVNAKRQSRLQFDAHCGVHSRFRVGHGSWFRRTAVNTSNLTVKFLTLPKCSTYATPRHCRCCSFLFLLTLVVLGAAASCCYCCCCCCCCWRLLRLELIQCKEVTRKSQQKLFIFPKDLVCCTCFGQRGHPQIKHTHTHTMYEIVGRKLSA